NPLWLVVAVVAIAAFARGRPSVWFRQWAVGLAALATLALILHIVFVSAQDNLAIIGLALPPALAIAWVATRAPNKGTREDTDQPGSSWELLTAESRWAVVPRF